MTTINHVNTASPTSAFLDELSLEGQIAAVLQQLEDSSRETDRQRALETDRRFQRAETALDLEHRANRLQLGASIFAGATGIAGGVLSISQSFSAQGGGADTPVEEVEHPRAASVSRAARGIQSATGAVGQPLERVAAEASRRASAAELAAERSLGHAKRFGQQAEADRSMRENLLRQLESILHERRRGDDVAAQSLR